MKNFARLLFILLYINVSAQESEKPHVQKTIETFFEGFHQQDTALMKTTVSDAVVMRRISMDSSGQASLRDQDFSEFLKAIADIPKTKEFEEIIKSYAIQVDGPMAHVWTPYEFRRSGNFSHCGTNSFQLFKEDGVWKIIYIIDTGRMDGCD